MDNTLYTPIVRWADNGAKIDLTVELSDAHQDPTISIEETSLTFKGFGRGAHGENLYSLYVEFYDKIDYKHSTWKVGDRNISFQIYKQFTKVSWPRLLKSKEKPGWLRIDFDKWIIEESDEENLTEQIDKITFEKRMKREIDKAKDDIGVFAKITWLTMYNAFQAVCFFIIFIKLIYGFYQHGADVVNTFYDDVSELLLTCQIAAFMEVIHPAVGLVKTGLTAPVLQVCGRGFMLFVLVLPVKAMHTNPVVYCLFCAWSCIEIIRYPFYLCALYHYNNVVIAWVRYSAWLILYPCGFTSEILLMYQSIVICNDTKRWEYLLPNHLNIHFSLSIFIKIFMFPYISGVLYLLKHMWILRKRKLGYGSRKTKQQ